MTAINIPGPPGPPGVPGQPGYSSGVREHPIRRLQFLNIEQICHSSTITARLSECWCVQVTVLRSYDIMTATARRQPEGALVYVIEQMDLYIRVRDGLRQVQVPREKMKSSRGATKDFTYIYGVVSFIFSARELHRFARRGRECSSSSSSSSSSCTMWGCCLMRGSWSSE